MANVNESAVWEPGIYRIETDDLVQGGETGVSNIQAKQLASRTAYLKQELEKPVGTADLGDGVVTNQKVASGQDASKLTIGTLPIARIPDGTIPNAKLAAFTQNLSGNGHITLPGGLIIQWGRIARTGGDTLFAFPIEFPNQLLGVVATAEDTDGGNVSGESNIGSTRTKVAVNIRSGTGPTHFNIIAVGK